MPFLHQDRLHALRLTFVVVWVLVPSAVLLAYSYALLAGATAMTLGVIAGLVFRRNHRRRERARSEEEWTGRWRTVLVTYLLFLSAGLAGRVAVGLGEMARNDRRLPHQGLVSGFVTLVIVVSLMRLTWLLAFMRREMGLPRKLAAASLLAVLCIGVQEPMLRRLLKRDDVPIYRIGAGILGPGAWRFTYSGAIAVEEDGRATSAERFILQPPEPDPRLVPEDLAPRILDAEWQTATEAAGVTVTSERIALSEEGRDGLQIELGGPIEVRILRLGVLLHLAHIAPSGPRTVPVAATPDQLESIRGRDGWQIRPWDGASAESAHLEVQVPGLPILGAGPTEQLEMKDRPDPLTLATYDPRRWTRLQEPVSFDFRWPPRSWAVIREPVRPRFEILYVPSRRFAWLRGLLGAAFVHRAVVNRFSLLIWPAGLVALWGYRREIRRDLEWVRTRRSSPPPASA